MKNYAFYFFLGLLALFLTPVLAVNDLFSNDSALKENPLLKSVPAETIFFSGNTQLFKMDDYPFFSLNQSFNTPLSQSERNALGKELSFLYELYLDLEATILQGNSVLQSHYGLPENIAVVLYTMGISPVLKITLEDEQAFLDVLNQAEKKSGFQHQDGTVAGQNYWLYPMGNKHQLIVSIKKTGDEKTVATIALLSNAANEVQKQLVFGLTQPAHSIETKVKTIQKENQYLPLSVSFLDFKALVRSLFKTRSKTNTPAEANPWIELLGDENQFFANLQASNCEADIMNLAQEMPQLIAGYKKYEVQEQRVIMDFEVLLELKNQNLKSELNRFRGFIPDYVRHGAQDNIVAFGLGLNFSQMSPFFIYMTRAFKESTFQCEQLKAMQKDVAQLNPLMLAMMTGLVDGVQGISFALQDFKAIKPEQTLDGQSSDKSSSYKTSLYDRSAMTFELSLIISLAAENPLKVWQMLTAFIPETALITPSEKPQKLNIAALDMPGLELFVAIKGQHLVLYSGEQAETISHALMDEKIVANGLLQETLNYTQLTQAMKELRHVVASPISPQGQSQQALPAEACIYFDESIAVLSRFSGFIDYQNDFVSNGWLNVLSADIEQKPKVKTDYQLPGKYETHYVQDGCQLVIGGLEEVLEDGTGFYQQYSADGQCFIFETRYRWEHTGEQMNLKYVSERSRPEGSCVNEFEVWAVPEPEFINDACQLRTAPEGEFACLYQWDGELTKSVYKRI